MAAATTAMAGALAKLDSREASLRNIADRSAEQVASLERSTLASQRISGILEQYSKVFAEAERSTAELIQSVGTEVQKLTEITQNHFERLVTDTDNHLGDAVKKLGGSVSELSETLDDFQEILSQAKPMTHSRERPA
jgi:DNA anti-recombination protein RmuC